MSHAICDGYAFEPFKNLVAGEVSRLEDFQLVERFIRTALLHDTIHLEADPLPPHLQVTTIQHELNRQPDRARLIAIRLSTRDYPLIDDEYMPDTIRVSLSSELGNFILSYVEALPWADQSKLAARLV